jgi:hypothetical protein
MNDNRDEIELHYKQGKAYKLLRDDITRYILFGGGKEGGKSWLGWVWLTLNCMQYEAVRYFVGRDELKRLRNTTLQTFYKMCKYYGISKELYNYQAQDHYIEFVNGSRIDLLELKEKPSDLMYERFGSTEYTGGWIEEGGEVAFGAFDSLKAIVGRHRNEEYNLLGKILITCNPKKNWMYTNIYLPNKRGTLSADYAFVQSLYGDNKYRARDAEKRLSEISNTAQKQRLKFGNWEYADDPDVLLTRGDIMQCAGGDPQPGTHYIGADIARFGSDNTTFALFNGNHLEKLQTYSDRDTSEVADLLNRFLIAQSVVDNHCGIDTVGLGAGVYDSLKDKGKHCIEIISGAKATKRTDSFEFKNLRSQMWWQFRTDVKERNIVIDSRDEELLTDLTAPKYEIKNETMIQVEPKDKIKKRIGRSPDKGDAVVYANAMRASIINRINIQTFMV